eukprot:1185591-Prorocentrum_minimum.AAC.1
MLDTITGRCSSQLCMRVRFSSRVSRLGDAMPLALFRLPVSSTPPAPSAPPVLRARPRPFVPPFLWWNSRCMMPSLREPPTPPTALSVSLLLSGTLESSAGADIGVLVAA